MTSTQQVFKIQIGHSTESCIIFEIIFIFEIKLHFRDHPQVMTSTQQVFKIQIGHSTESCISKRSAGSKSKIWSLYCEQYRQTFQKLQPVSPVPSLSVYRCSYNKCFKIRTALRIERAAFCAHSLPPAPPLPGAAARTQRREEGSEGRSLPSEVLSARQAGTGERAPR